MNLDSCTSVGDEQTVAYQCYGILPVKKSDKLLTHATTHVSLKALHQMKEANLKHLRIVWFNTGLRVEVGGDCKDIERME